MFCQAAEEGVAKSLALPCRPVSQAVMRLTFKYITAIHVTF